MSQPTLDEILDKTLHYLLPPGPPLDVLRADLLAWADMRARQAESAASNMRMMLLKLARKPDRYTREEIEAAIQRWWPTSPLRALDDEVRT